MAGVAQRQIAEQVGIKAASLYHFDSNEIVEAVFRQGIDVMEHAWDEAAAAWRPTSAPASLPTSSPSLRTLRKQPLHRCPRRCVPDGTGRSPRCVVPMRDAYEAAGPCSATSTWSTSPGCTDSPCSAR